MAAAEAAVAQAQAGLDAARAALAQAELRAPFAGRVVAVDVDVGEALFPGQPALTLAALDAFEVQTTDLSERDVVRVVPGQRASVYVEALDLRLAGRVVRVAARPETVGGDVVYRVTIALDEQPAGLRWGMTADVEIEVE
mgnify:CR=1 FL=1